VAGPPLRLVSSYPENGAGFACDRADPSCGVPLDASIELRFDRFLLPTTAVRQSIRVYAGNLGLEPGVGDAITPDYDVYERVVRYVLPAGKLLVPRALYSVELPIAAEEGSVGFRAFDGAALEGEEPVRFSFFTGSSPGEPEPPPEVLGCEDTLCVAFGGAEPGCGLPLESGCAAGSCHGTDPSQAQMGLMLASPDDFDRTAIARVAHGAETGPTTGAVAVTSERFGVAMPLIDPGRPDNSYLFYKLLIAPEAYEASDDSEDACTGTRHLAPVDPSLCFAPPTEELERLGEWFVQGDAMPATEYGPRFVRRREMRALQDFIAAGASCGVPD
jgi:hypothetical protein